MLVHAGAGARWCWCTMVLVHYAVGALWYWCTMLLVHYGVGADITKLSNIFPGFEFTLQLRG